MKVTIRSRQRGITLLEVLVSLGIMASVFVGVATVADQYVSDTKTSLTAQQMVTVGNAAQAYIKDNYTTVMANATATTPALITVPMLIGAGYLQTGFSTQNNYGHDVCVLVVEPTPNNLNALVVAEGGNDIDDLALGSLAASIGAAGGGVYSTDPTTLRGAMGGWSLSVGNFANANHLNQKCNGTGGTPAISAGRPTMALWFANGDVTSGFLYRNAVPGRPELNAMNTPMVMNSVQTANTACTTTGAIARDSTGAILTCQAGLWKGSSASETAGQYAFFNAASCPSGWVAANGANGTVDLRGTFVRALDAGRGLDAGRALGTYQADTFQNHSHLQNGAAVGGWVSIGAGDIYYGETLIARYSQSTTGASGSAGSETRPKNVALLACMKT